MAQTENALADRRFYNKLGGQHVLSEPILFLPEGRLGPTVGKETIAVTEAALGRRFVKDRARGSSSKKHMLLGRSRYRLLAH